MGLKKVLSGLTGFTGFNRLYEILNACYIFRKGAVKAQHAASCA